MSRFTRLILTFLVGLIVNCDYLGGTSAIADEGHVHIFPESNYIKDKESGVKMKICSCGLKLPLDSEEKL